MVTVVTFDESWTDGDKLFRTQGRSSFWVKSFKNGVVTVDVPAGAEITKFSEMIVGCFRIGSNFEEEIKKVFNSKDDLKMIQFDFNGVTVSVTKENLSVKAIVSKWRKDLEEEARKERLEWEAYMQTEEYKLKRAKELKSHIRRKTVEKQVIEIDKETELEFKDDEAKQKWEEWIKINSKGSYNLCTVDFARRWAKYMQHIMKKHNKSISQIANKTRSVSDIDGITGFMYGISVSVLSQCWKYGDDLKKWHNKEWGHEDAKGVINPAIISIG